MNSKLKSRIKKYSLVAASMVLITGASQMAQADVIPYSNVGTYNNTSYSFTASSTGDVIAYIVGGFTAGYENQMGLFDVTTNTLSAFGLDNHSSSMGDSFNLGHVNIGDTLVFVLHNITLGMDAFSDPAMNVSYDPAGPGLNHIYSTPYTATSPLFSGVPVGTYVAFEDLQIPGADFNYDDESFVFTNVNSRNSVPEPATMLLFGSGLAGLAGVIRKKRG